MSSRIERIGSATLYLGDCRDVLPTLSGVDAVVTDPPYGIDRVWQGGFSRRHGWGHQTGQARAERNAWDEAPADVMPLLSIGAAQIIWGGNYFPLPPSRGWLVWKKPGSGFSLSDAELAWTSIDQPVRCLKSQRLTALNGELCAGGPVKPNHPTQKPIAVMKWCLSFVSGVVLDPYMGSGTTGVACARLGRTFVGIERHEPYFRIACHRIEEAQRQSDLFITPPPTAKPKQEAML